MSQRTKIIILVLIIIFINFNVQKVLGGSCSTSVIPTSLSLSSDTSITFSVTNSASNPIKWVRLDSPSSDFEISGTGNIGSWGVNEQSASYISFFTEEIAPGSNQAFEIYGSTGGNNTIQNFSVSASEDFNGADPFGCGSATVTIGTIAPTVIPTTSSTSTTTQVVTETVTKTEKTVVTKIIEIRDTAPPVVSLTGDFSKPFEQPPELSGKASDKSRIATVEYSVDGGENWLPVDEITSPGQVSTEFRFIPSIFDDGNYEILVRAIDGAGNKGMSKSQTLIIDRLPPLIGASIFTLGPLILQPDRNGTIITTTGVEQKVTLSAAGGPTAINLFVGNLKHPLTQSVETGLWSGTVKFESVGVYQVAFNAVDGGGNKTEGNLVRVMVVKAGQVVDKKSNEPIQNATVSLFQKDEQTGEWYLWDGTPFNQISPQITRKNGEYQYFLPPGTYYFKVEAGGYEGVISQIFSLSLPTPINSQFSLAKKSFPFQLRWDKVEVTLNIPETTSSEQTENSMMGKITPDFNTLRGKSAIVTFLNSWSPLAIDQITILDRLFKKEGSRIHFQAIAVQERSSKVNVFALRGGYEIPFAADPDGTLAQKFSAQNLPTHVFLDRKGVVKKIVSGVLSEEELLGNF